MLFIFVKIIGDGNSIEFLRLNPLLEFSVKRGILGCLGSSLDKCVYHVGNVKSLTAVAWVQIWLLPFATCLPLSLSLPFLLHFKKLSDNA